MAFGDLKASYTQTINDSPHTTVTTSVNVVAADGDLVIACCAGNSPSVPTQFVAGDLVTSQLFSAGGAQDQDIYAKVQSGALNDTVSFTQTSDDQSALLVLVYEGPFDSGFTPETALRPTETNPSNSGEIPAITPADADTRLMVGIVMGSIGDNQESFTPNTGTGPHGYDGNGYTVDTPENGDFARGRALDALDSPGFVALSKVVASTAATGSRTYAWDGANGTGGPDSHPVNRGFQLAWKQATAAVPTITDAGDEAYNDAEAGIVITGTNLPTDGTGSTEVLISPTDNVNDVSAVTQTITNYGGGTSLTFTAVQGALPELTNLYLFVVDSAGASNASGFVVQFNDQTAPTLSSPTANSITGTGVFPIVTTNEGNGTVYARVYADGATPSAAQVLSGTGVTPVASATPETATAPGAINFGEITGLTSETAYELFFVHEDAGGNLSAVQSVGFTTLDNTAPVLTGPTAGSVTSASVAASVTTDEANGAIWARVYADGATPTAEQVFLGTGPTPIASATGAAVVIGAGSVSCGTISGLSAGTPYELFFAHQDAAGNYSNAASVGFTTQGGDTAAPVITSAAEPSAVSDTTFSFDITATDASTFQINVLAVARGAAQPSNAAIDGGQTTGLTSGVEATVTYTGLTAETEYDLWYRLVDSGGNATAAQLIQAVTAATGGGGITAADRLHIFTTGRLP